MAEYFAPASEGSASSLGRILSWIGADYPEIAVERTEGGVWLRSPDLNFAQLRQVWLTLSVNELLEVQNRIQRAERLARLLA